MELEIKNIVLRINFLLRYIFSPKKKLVMMWEKKIIFPLNKRTSTKKKKKLRILRGCSNFFFNSICPSEGNEGAILKYFYLETFIQYTEYYI